MKNVILFLVFTMLLFNINFSIAQDTLTAVDVHGALQIEGTQLISTKHGKPVQLRGMSLFWSQWGDGSKFYNEGVIDQLVTDWKINVIRAAMGVAVADDGYLKNPEREKNKVKTIVDAAIAKGIYVIIDWHSHAAENEEVEAKAFFAEMAQLYGSYPNVIYELYNEPTKSTWSGAIKPYCEAVIDTIRAHDSDNLIICGTRNWSQEVEEVATNMIDDVNVAYTLHFYAATHTQNLRDKAQRAIDKGVPIFVTEFGTCAADGDGNIDAQETRLWWDFLAKNNISWCNWSVSNKMEAASAFLPGSSSVGVWSVADYSVSGNLVRDELRRTYQLPVYENGLTIKADSIDQVLKPDSTFKFNFATYLENVLLADSLVTYKLEITDGGSISDSAIFTPTGKAGAFRLLITAIYDSLVTTKAITFNISDVKPGELTNKEDKTYLALTSTNNYKLSANIIYPNQKTAIPIADSTIIINNETYTWKITNEPSGIFSQADSLVKSYLAIYVINPIARQANIRKDTIGTSKIYVNGNLIGANDFPLLQGENIFFIEYSGTTDSSAFDFTLLTSEGDLMPYLSYSTSTNGFFDCANTWKGTAYLADCGCIGGVTGMTNCPGPFNGSPVNIPGIIEMEEYDYGLSGVTFYDTDAKNNGNSTMRFPDGVDISTSPTGGGVIGWINTGEWLKYSVAVKKEGKYVVDFSIASAQSTGALMLKMNGKSLFKAALAIPNTGDWGVWEYITSDTIQLKTGNYILQFLATNQSFNIDNMAFRFIEPTGFHDAILLNTNVYPNPFAKTFQLSVKEQTDFKLYSTLGVFISQGSCNGNCTVGADLDSGMYILELQQRNKKAVKRIIKE